MINKNFYEQAKELANERNITVEDVYEIFKKSLVNSYKKTYGNSSCKVILNPEKNEILLYGLKKVVEEFTENPSADDIEEILLEDAKKIKSSAKVGDILEQNINFKNFGRTAVQASKNICVQDVRTKQRENAYEYFKQLEGEMITATVTNITEKFITLDMGYNTSTTMPKGELLPSDHPRINDRIKVFLRRVELTNADPKLNVSRTDRNLLNRLLENYIPEIKDGTILIKGIARDPGDRCKIAVESTNPNVDPIGSCVGEGGQRIKEIVNALGGEKVDLYRYSDDPEELITNSLQPASVTKILSVDLENKTSVVVVPDNQLSLAIGKSGQNVRLAVQSSGWKIDIMPTSEAYDKGLILNFGK